MSLLVLERLPKYFILANNAPNCVAFATGTPYNSGMLCNTATLKKGIFI
jgi:Zn-dependent protease with chaperone function